MLINVGDDVTTHENIGNEILSQILSSPIHDEVVTET